MKSKADYVNMILEVAEELGMENENFDKLMERGFRYINPNWTDEENREILIANL